MIPEPFSYRLPPPPKNSKKLPEGKTCKTCWNLDNGLNCRVTKGVSTNSGFTNYCHWSENRFTEEAVIGLIVQIDVNLKSKHDEFPGEISIFGNKDEMMLHNILTRAKYQCECDGVVCGLHSGRCGTMHVLKGGKSPLLLQPKNAKKAHSEENSSVQCAPCANANTVNLMTINRKKKKTVQNDNQISII